MTHSPESPLPAGWHAALLRGLCAAEVGSLAAAGGLASSAGVALAAFFEWGNRIEGLFAPAAVLLFLVALVALLLGALPLARAVVHIDRGGSFAAIYLGTVLLIGTGLLEAVADLTVAARIAHAVYALFAVTLLAAGVVGMRRNAAALRQRLAVDDPDLDRRARRLRILALLVVGASLLLPFAPVLLRSVLPGVTPRACLVYSGVAGALIAALPFIGLARLLHRVRSAARHALPALPHCPACGYPRPPGTRCPECGLDAR